MKIVGILATTQEFTYQICLLMLLPMNFNNFLGALDRSEESSRSEVIKINGLIILEYMPTRKETTKGMLVCATKIQMQHTLLAIFTTISI